MNRGYFWLYTELILMIVAEFVSIFFMHQYLKKDNMIGTLAFAFTSMFIMIYISIATLKLFIVKLFENFQKGVK